MAFELKVLDKIHCPRCNAKAEERIDVKKTDTKWVLVYVVCPTCRLNRYMYTTTRKTIKNKMRVAKLRAAAIKNPKRSKVYRGAIAKLERELPDAERNF